jgi:phosphoribosylaminoimidazole-succinocarboxamide synthase
MLPLECVVRGYLAGSAWQAYVAGDPISGRLLPAGLLEAARLPEPLFTPSTKARAGHDETIDLETAADLVGADRVAELERLSLELYAFAASQAEARGLILADTKFEFGLDEHGELVLADEVFTPDSSRFWPADEYGPGRPQASFDKQYARDFCAALPWDKTDPGPELPPAVVAGTRSRYLDAFERICGVPFAAYVADPDVVLA